jgi:hypothetical protein
MKITADVAEPGDTVLALEGTSQGGVFTYRDATGEPGTTAGTPAWFVPGLGSAVAAPQGVLALLVRHGSQYCCTPDPEPVG